MRAVIQRVSEANVVVDGGVVGRIGAGLLVYVGVASNDEAGDAEYVAGKIRYLRIFPDAAGKMNLDVAQAGGAVLVVSNFTLQADTREGRRPSFTGAASGESAKLLYELVCEKLQALGVTVERGIFGAMMAIASVGDGPINVLLDSKE
jgi:D-tyrosyl-tRNA(Tyr) deacylase